VGITVRRGVSFHGLALNVNTDMEPFSWINPCGLDQVRMTSLERHLSGPVAMAEARQEMAAHLAEGFGIALTTVSLQQLYAEIELGD
jgi:lipoate-protein ligase B